LYFRSFLFLFANYIGDFDRRSDDRLEQLIASGRSPMSRCINSPNRAPSQNTCLAQIAAVGRRPSQRIEPIQSPRFEYWLGGGILWLA
jgi:hypothetical protein